jgi:hypothetical protein
MSTLRTSQLQTFPALFAKLGSFPILKLAAWAFHFFSLEAELDWFKEIA